MKTFLPAKTGSVKFARIAIAALMTSALIPLHSAFAQTASETINVMPDHTTSTALERAISREAAQVLRQIANARTAIHLADFDAAKADLYTAMDLLEDIQGNLPTTRVHDHIWSAKQHIDYDSIVDVRADLVPVMADLDAIRDSVSVDAARKHVKKADKKLQAGDKSGAREELKQADETLVYTEFDLPVSSSLEKVDAAIAALRANDPTQANAALAAAEDGVVYLSTSDTVPIGQARRSLWQASKDYTAKDYAATKADLADAGAWLHKAASHTDKTTRDETEKLAADVKAMDSKVGSASDKTGAELSALWARSKALSERGAERASASWDGAWTKSSAKAHLIDAKLHLSFARTAAFVSGKSGEIKQQLNQASADLDKAAKDAAVKSNQKLQKSIAASKADITRLKANIGDKSAAAKAHYDKVIADLHRAIRDL